MNNGFIKVAAASPDLRVADVAYNKAQIIATVERAAADGVRVLCLPELAITGYTCGDLFGSRLLIDAAKKALVEIVQATADLPVFFAVGLPYLHNGKLYNVAAAVCGGRLLGLVPKTNIPSYGEFYERRNFTPWNAEQTKWTDDYVGNDRSVNIDTDQIFMCTDLPELKIGIEICEDAWVTIPPSSYLAQKGATVILNLSASDEVIGKADYRRQLISSQSAKIVGGYVYADAGLGESTTDLVFSGHNLIAENGTILAESKPFGSGYAVNEIDLQRIVAERARMTTFETQTSPDDTWETEFSLPLESTTLTRRIARRPFVPDDEATLRRRCESIVTMQAEGLARRVKQIGCKCVIGISGGLDSTLALLVTVRAFDLLGRDRREIITVTMPGFGTTSRTKSNAELLCESLGVTFRTIPIGNAVKQHLADIGHDGITTDVTYENSQARERTQILMDVANMENGIVVGTGDLSELALGWATYNGDHMSMYGVNASIPKTLVRHLVAYFAAIATDETQKRVLLDILDTPVSPELLPAKDGEIAQKTEDLVGPYDLHDFFLYYLLRFGFAPDKIYRLAKIAWGEVYDATTILKWLKIFLRRFFAQQFKRSCLPDGPKVGTVTLSPRGDWRMPSDASAALWLAEAEKIKE
ncbi:MAG: NAD(+) synthase [Clostridia bacterium]|nr:NAD(+) synthase [Clostridia bacterium]